MASSNKPVEVKEVPNNEDVEKNKVYGVLAYIGILFLVPLLAAPESKFAKFHANQGCVLFLAGLVSSFVLIIPILGWIAGFFGGIFVFVLAIMGIVNALNGKMEKLPLLGNIELIK